MADQNGSAKLQENVAPGSDAKGKGKAAEPATHENMEVDDSSSDEEVDEIPVDEPDEDNMEEIDTENIIPDGRRTRGRQIDFAKAAKDLPEEEDDEEDDEEYEAAADDKMEE
ncbi:Histone H2A.Z-specific chaperone CHZ1 [Lachnellula suecica]|uniref:Histone H2A.Z-specific chaperone CHZ1 n=1 Tax=Lachnellula suecica TaxID=602035 RepID=A0A8T9CIW6_9HELO|nr:Histone H2A.Z-specific chaperone CHZ1 [Lachnellula suecica]